MEGTPLPLDDVACSELDFGVVCNDPKLIACKMCCAASHASSVTFSLSLSFPEDVTVFDAVFDAVVVFAAAGLLGGGVGW